MATPGTLRRIGAIIALSAAGFLNGCAVSGRFGPGGDRPDLFSAAASIGREAERAEVVERPEQLRREFEPIGRAAASPPAVPVIESEVKQDQATLNSLDQSMDRIAESTIPSIMSADKEIDSFGMHDIERELNRLLKSGNVQEFIRQARALSPEHKALALLGLLACLIVLVRSRRARAQQANAARLLATQRSLETTQLQVTAALAATLQQAEHMVQETKTHFTAMSQAFGAKLDRALAESQGRERKFAEALHDISALVAIAHPKNEEQANRLAQAIVARILKARGVI